MNISRQAGPAGLVAERISVLRWPGSLDLPMLVLICIACVLIFRLRMDMLKVLGLCAVSGIVWTGIS